MDLDAVVYPSGNIPPGILTAPPEPTVNDRGLNWTTISSRGFAALTVPAGFTTSSTTAGPTARCCRRSRRRCPSAWTSWACPFTEQTVFAIGAAYEAATRHRAQPPGFGPLDR